MHRHRTGVSPLILPYRTICKPGTDEAAIRKAVQNATRNSPRGLINTISGGLVDKSKRAPLFESLPGFNLNAAIAFIFVAIRVASPILSTSLAMHMIVTKRSLDKVVTEDRRRKPDFHSSDYSNLTRLDLRQLFRTYVSPRSRKHNNLHPFHDLDPFSTKLR